jgi:hypothetical protein
MSASLRREATHILEIHCWVIAGQPLATTGFLILAAGLDVVVFPLKMVMLRLGGGVLRGLMSGV